MRLILGAVLSAGLLVTAGSASACFGAGELHSNKQIACAEMLIKQVQLLRERVEGLGKTLAEPGYALIIERDRVAVEHVPMSSKNSCHAAILAVIQNETSSPGPFMDEVLEERKKLGVDGKYYRVGMYRLACLSK